MVVLSVVLFDVSQRNSIGGPARMNDMDETASASPETFGAMYACRGMDRARHRLNLASQLSSRLLHGYCPNLRAKVRNFDFSICTYPAVPNVVCPVGPRVVSDSSDMRAEWFSLQFVFEIDQE